MRRSTILLVVVSLVALSPGLSQAQEIGQTTFLIPKKFNLVKQWLLSDDRANVLLTYKLDEKLEEDFPSDSSQVKEVFVRVLGYESERWFRRSQLQHQTRLLEYGYVYYDSDRNQCELLQCSWKRSELVLEGLRH